MGPVEGDPEVIFQRVRKTNRGHHPRPSRSTKHLGRPAAWTKGSYVAHTFSGIGAVAKAVRRFPAREWELKSGPRCGLTDRKVRQVIKSDASQGKLLAGCVALPCYSFSGARDRLRAIRSRSHPWGLPNPLPQDAPKINEGNKCLQAALDSILHFHSLGILWILEKPT